jgi:hypothetical protein
MSVSTSSPIRSDEAQWLLAALAFEMVREGNFEGVSEGAFLDFRKRLWKRHRRETPPGTRPTSARRSSAR